MLKLNGTPIEEMAEDQLLGGIDPFVEWSKANPKMYSKIQFAAAKLMLAVGHDALYGERDVRLATSVAAMSIGMVLSGCITFGDGPTVFGLSADGALEIPESFLRAFGEEDGTDANAER